MKIKITKTLETIALTHYVTKECIKLLAKHQKYFGASAMDTYFEQYNNGNINYEDLMNNLYKDVTDYESAL